MNNPFKRFFIDEDENASSDLAECHQVIEFARCEYFNKFLGYLERGADAKLDVSTATTMLASAERINTFKDIRAFLRRQVRDSQNLIDRETRDE